MSALHKHTSGPWKAAVDLFRPPKVFVHGPDSFAICRVMTAHYHAEVAKANAHVLAAAPEMLAVLRDMEWLGLNDGRGVTHRQCPACSALQSRGTGHNPHCGLAAAIAKAEGRS